MLTLIATFFRLLLVRRKWNRLNHQIMGVPEGVNGTVIGLYEFKETCDRQVVILRLKDGLYGMILRRAPHRTFFRMLSEGPRFAEAGQTPKIEGKPSLANMWTVLSNAENHTTAA